MEHIKEIFILIHSILAGAGLMAIIIFCRWNYCLGKLIKEQEKQHSR